MMKKTNVTIHVDNGRHEIEQENQYKYHYWTCGGKTSIQGYTTLKEARWDARANGEMVIDNAGKVVLDYRD